MLKPLARDVSAIAFAENIPDLKIALTHALNRLGFVSYNFSVNRASPKDFMEKPTFTTWTTQELDTYINDKWYERDPLMKLLKARKAPLLWQQENFNTPDNQEYYDYVHLQGITDGLTLPLLAEDGKFSSITLLSIDAKPKPADIVDAVSILTDVAMARMTALTEGQFCDHDLRRFDRLSGLQVEILGWMAKGKTNNEISRIVTRSERAIAYHVSEILGKIGVASRAQAAAFYAALGMKS